MLSITEMTQFFLMHHSTKKFLTVENDKVKLGAKMKEVSKCQLWYEDENGNIRNSSNDYGMKRSGSYNHFYSVPIPVPNRETMCGLTGSRTINSYSIHLSMLPCY